MAPAHQKTSKAAERRRTRRQRRAEAGTVPERGTRAPKVAPLSMDPRKRAVAPPLIATRLDEETEYAFVRRDLWRLTVYSLICFALMIGVLFWLNA